MVTFKPIVAPNSRRKDGTYPVKIRVTYKGVVRRLPTTLVCYANDLTRAYKIKNPSILDKAGDLIKRMRAVTDNISPFDLEGRDVDWVVSTIKDSLTTDSFHLDFFEWGDKYVLCKTERTRVAYTTAMNTFARFLGKREIDINAISRTLLLDFVDFVDAEPKMQFVPDTGEWIATDKAKIAKGASSRHIMKLQHIFNAAKDRYNDEDSGRILIPRSPFDKIEKVFPPSQGQKSLGQELMQRIIQAETSDPVERVALDIFIVSFGLMGANMADLYASHSFVGDTWRYNRQKTATRRADKAEMQVTIPEELHPFLERLSKGKGGWWLPALHEYASTCDICTSRVNRALKRWARENGVPEFTFYAARHTFATLCRKCGVDKGTLDDCLCHRGDFVMADIYAEKSWELVQEANRKVIDLFTWG